MRDSENFRNNVGFMPSDAVDVSAMTAVEVDEVAVTRPQRRWTTSIRLRQLKRAIPARSTKGSTTTADRKEAIHTRSTMVWLITRLYWSDGIDFSETRRVPGETSISVAKLLLRA